MRKVTVSRMRERSAQTVHTFQITYVFPNSFAIKLFIFVPNFVNVCKYTSLWGRRFLAHKFERPRETDEGIAKEEASWLPGRIEALFAKLRKATMGSSCLSVRLSVRLLETNRQPLDGFS